VQIDRNAALRQYVQAVNDIILMRMGCNIQPQQKALDGTETHSCYVSEGEAELCMRIISLTK